MRHALGVDEVARGGRAEDRVGLVEVADRDHRVEEEAGLLLDGHLGEQELDALGDGQARVEPGAVGDGGLGIRHCGGVGHLTPRRSCVGARSR